MEKETEIKIKTRADAVTKIKSNPNMIAIGNQLITARHDLTKSQFALLRFLQLNITNLDDFTKATVNVLDYKKYIGAKSNTIYDLIRKDLYTLFKTEIHVSKEHSWHKTTIISQLDFETNDKGIPTAKGIGTYTIHFPPLISGFLLDLKDNFTYLELRFILSLKSLYSMRFFELCKKNLIIKNFKITVEEIKLMFGLKGYKDYNNLKTKVIKVAYDELKERSTIYFEFEEIKEGRAVVALNFVIIDNNIKTKYLEVSNDFINYKTQQFAITQNRLDSLVKEYSQNKVYEILDYFLDRRNKVKKGLAEPIINEAAYLVNMLKNHESVVKNTIESKKIEVSQIYIPKERIQKSEKETFEDERISNFYNNFYSDIIKLIRIKIGKNPDLINETLTFILDDYSRLIHGKTYLSTYDNINNVENFLQFINVDSTFLISVQWAFQEKIKDKEMIDLKNKSQIEAKSLNIPFYY